LSQRDGANGQAQHGDEYSRLSETHGAKCNSDW
jgi:hypothetical protein